MFREIRDLLYAEESVEVPQMDGAIASEYVGLAHEINSIHKVLAYSKNNEISSNSLVRSDKTNFEALDFEPNLMPNLSGMTSMDALYLLENLGVQVELNGKGKVRKQSLKAGDEIEKNHKVILRLS